ncbi:MAG: adenylate/guanylate cyclase domain-containing protein [Candidatus Cloacimonetes bacterium]|jgi:adenylate cyclase|nr:adenylate/guanylate cyclase domain-containing protein [Candidatus Cloacimonadota bacterium]MCB5286916.1 adenylate/guanylate cyclase domain-containing protein [Candidatus Cloacimonadota bacterium]MCK9184142.1 adenylate/guanylate cyclase domain-containing protein [Candidatus Cloacimonadota bacterium]MCK9584371.1 adenylate/guanylate cyclase domain-containing protein [Candidatus Cloacimonadota bacterium]MDY0229237.1 adenylate/guanylate cyclase domain-containing protein [Candidatus Cloacimonadace
MSKYRSILLALIIILVIKGLFLFPSFHSLDFKAQDSLFKLRHKLEQKTQPEALDGKAGKRGAFRLRAPRTPNEDVVIIAIDDASFSALNTSWPFPREYHAKLIQNLSLAGARLIVFDVEFTENSSPGGDALLAEMASYYDNVIFAGKVLRGAGPHDPDQLLSPIAEIMRYEIPWGIVNMSSDSDNLIRKYDLFELHDDTPYYSLGVAALANSRIYTKEWQKHIRIQKDKLLVAENKIPFLGHNKALINFYGPASTFPQISYASVMDDSTVSMPGYQGLEFDEFYEILESGILKDKIVLVGATIDELHDKFPTPLGGNWTPGVEIHANFLSMVMDQDYLSELNPWLYLCIELIILLLMWCVFRKLKPQFSALLVILFIALQYLLALLLFVNCSLLIPILQTAVSLAFIYITSLLCHYLDTMKEKRFIRQAFQQYMAPELVSELLKNPKNLSYGGSLQEISVLFSDIRSFTTYSENHTPQETVNILKEYLTAMVNVIVENKGILDKFVGDEIMALFGTPMPLPNHALSACTVALQMRDKMTELQQKWESEGRVGFEIGIGVNTGQAVVGNLGSEQIFDYTAIGDTINLGARLEGINKEYETSKHIIISEFTLEQVKDLVKVKYLDEVKVKGKNKAVKIYELIDLADA